MGTIPGTDEPRFPGYDVLGQVNSWDIVTRGVVLARFAPVGSLAFFTAAEEPTPAPSLIDCSPRKAGRGCQSSR